MGGGRWRVCEKVLCDISLTPQPGAALDYGIENGRMNPCCESLCWCASLGVAEETLRKEEEKHFHPVTSVALTDLE